ncbi:MAG: hypothetical protein LBH05_07880 [Deferribacteraceae bacterium]|nr:hypothetical protein [Deferribacteraceae bacterium]
MEKIIHRQDNTFVIEHNGMPYHLTSAAEPERGIYAATLDLYKTDKTEFEEEYPPEPPTPEEIRKAGILAEIAELKKFLTDTDYRAIKHFEGFLTEEEYEPYKQERKKARDKIKALEAELI